MNGGGSCGPRDRSRSEDRSGDRHAPNPRRYSDRRLLRVHVLPLGTALRRISWTHALPRRAGTHAPVNAGKNVQQVLLERRPDPARSSRAARTPTRRCDITSSTRSSKTAAPPPRHTEPDDRADLAAGPPKVTVIAELGAKFVPIGADASPTRRTAAAVGAGRPAGARALQDRRTAAAADTPESSSSAAELRAN